MYSRRRISFAVLLLSLGSLIALVCSQHRVRLIAGSFSKLDSAGEASWTPHSNASNEYMPVGSASQHGFNDAVRTITNFHERYPTLPGDPLPTIDDPDSCEHYLEQGRPLHCYNVDIGMSKILAAQGMYARMWDLCGPGPLGGFGHNLLEVWDDSARAWKALDPYYHCYFTLGEDSAPVSLGALRMALLRTHQTVTVHPYYHTTGERPASEIISEYRFLAPSALLHANNDFGSRYHRRYGLFMPFASLFDNMSLRTSRAVRTVMLGSADMRYIVEDADGPHYPILVMKLLFYGLLVLIVVSFVLLVQKPKREHVGRASSLDTFLA